MALQTIFFDAAGTLIHLKEPVGQTYATFAAQHGIQVEEQALKNAFRYAWNSLPAPLHPSASPDDDRSWWRSLVSEVFTHALGTPLPEEALDPLFADLYDHFALPQAWAVYEDVQPALEDLSRDHRLLVLSNFDRRLRSILEGHQLTPFFETILLSSEIGASKPHPRVFKAALDVADCPPEACLHVGDDPVRDIEGAQSQSIWTYHVTRPDAGLIKMVQKVRSNAYSNLR